MTDKEAFDAPPDPYRNVVTHTSYVDADGRAEFWGIREGTYRISVWPNPSRAAVEKEGDKYAAHVTCSRVSAPFEIKNPKTFSELKPEDAIRISLPDANASAVGQFVLRKNASAQSVRNNAISSSTTVTIKGENASGNVGIPQITRNQNGVSTTSKLRIVGTLPAFLAPAKSTVGMTLIEGIIPGKYKVLVTSWIYDSTRNTQEWTEDVVAAEFEIKAGEFKKLGTITVEPSTTIKHSRTWGRRVSEDFGDPPTDEDMDTPFEP